MRKNFTLIASLLLAFSTSVKAADITIDPSSSLATVYSGASSGDVIILGDGSYQVDANITMTKAITIKAQNAKMATIKGAGFLFTTNSTGDLTVKDVILDAAKTVTPVTYASYVVDFNGTYPLAVNNILFDNCTITNYGNCFLRANRGECTCESFKVNNCIIKNNGSVSAYPFYQATKTKFGTSLELTNSTIADFANEYIQNYSTTAGGNNDATYLFKNNTFYNTVTVATRKPFTFTSGKVYVQNNIFVKSTTGTRTADVAINAAVTTAEFTNNVVNDYDAGALLTSTGWSVSSGNLDVVPGFKDVANYDFTLPTGSALITANIGDPRWMGITAAVSASKSNDIKISASEGKIQLSAVANAEIINISGQSVKSATDVQTISTSNLASGIYIVKATNATGSKIQKVVIK
jgi:hypothetical protein